MKKEELLTRAANGDVIIDRDLDVVYPIKKEKTDETDEKSFTIFKTDDDQHLVFGWASVSITVDGQILEDRQHDTIDPEDLEEAAYEYVLNFRDTGEEHMPGYRKKGKLVESCVFTAEKQKAMGIPEGVLPVAWWIGFKIDDEDTWQRVKNGTYKMFSIEGRAQREEIQKAESTARSFDEVLKFNPNHDNLGRFSSANGTAGGSFKIYDDYSSSVVEDQPQISYEERVQSYSQKEALANYTSGHGLLNYENTNDYLNGKKKFSAEDQKQLDENIAKIDSCIKGKTDKDIMVFRGIAADINDIEVGDEILNKGYTSTATSKGIADDFANYYEGTTISVRVPKGTAALFIGYNTAGDFDETEMLFGRNAKITIVEKTGNEVIGELSYV